MTSSNLFTSGIRGVIDAYLLEKSKEKRDYGDYWSASSAGYCMRKNIFDRLGVPPVTEDARKTRVFEVGDIFHAWIQDITKSAGLSVAQELELQDEELMIRGHIDDLVLVGQEPPNRKSLILYDYKTQHSRAFQWAKKNGNVMNHYHKMQLGTYMYMIRNLKASVGGVDTKELTEARIMKISKDDLCMLEQQLLWSPALEKEVVGYWSTLNGYWKARSLPKCTCADFEGGFMAKETYNPYYYHGEPCSGDWLLKWKEENGATSIVQQAE